MDKWTNGQMDKWTNGPTERESETFVDHTKQTKQTKQTTNKTHKTDKTDKTEGKKTVPVSPLGCILSRPLLLGRRDSRISLGVGSVPHGPPVGVESFFRGCRGGRGGRLNRKRPLSEQRPATGGDNKCENSVREV
jgi:hypothetical protein